MELKIKEGFEQCPDSHYTPDDIIDVIFKEREGEYHFTYMDNGPGIEKEYRDKVFQMFETLDNTDNNNTGIGLTTIKSIINRLGGKINLDKREDNKKGMH